MTENVCNSRYFLVMAVRVCVCVSGHFSECTVASVLISFYVHVKGSS